jgi:hypothetical protein
MKKNFKNTTIFNYKYLDTLVEYLNKETVDQESKIALLQRLLTAIEATEQGERNEYYKSLKKNLTEHKAIEHIIELLVKKEFPALQAVQIDYSHGIFEVLRIHKDAVKDAVISILNRELSSFVTAETPLIESLKTEDLFDHYTIILNNLLEMRQIGINQLEPLVSQSCEHALNHVSSLCDQLNQAFNNHTITDSKFAMRVAYMLDHHKAALADVWGNLRLSFLLLAARRQTIKLIQEQKSDEPVKSEAVHEHSSSCGCQEHQE